MEASTIQDFDLKITSLRAIVESANKDIDTLERAKVIMFGDNTIPELPFPKTGDERHPLVHGEHGEAIGPMKFVKDSLKSNPTKKWSPSALALEFGRINGSESTAKALQDNRLAMHGALRSLVERGLIKQGEPDHLKVRLYWWVGKTDTPGKVA